jgi:arsenite methyltransferase
MNDSKADQTRTLVREHYGQVARAAGGCCGATPCGYGQTLGYSEDDQRAAPDGADLGLGCGNPTAIAGLRPGETVLDLGAGAGFDSFLAARQVGPTGRVIGVDMTPDMVSRARANAAKVAATNVDFRLGEIERLPVADASIDVILSNCVINLSPEKPAVFREAFRVLRPGGRLAISDVVATAEIPAEVRTQAAALTGCIAGATPIDELRGMLRDAGFDEIVVTLAPQSAAIVGTWMPGIERFLASATIEAVKPGPATSCCAPQCCP